MLQEFDISITAVGNDRYLVRTEQVAPGVPLAQEQFHWPIDHWLSEASTLMHDPLLGLLKGESSQRWANKPNYRSGSNDDAAAKQVTTLVSLGRDLYNSVFDRALRDSWLTAQGVAQNRRSPLRLRLGLKGEKIQQLPWEVLHAGDRPLGTGTDVTFSRYHLDRRQGYDRPVATIPDFDQPLRVLMVIAAPNDQDRLELAQEANHLKNELHPMAMRSGEGYNINPKQQLDVQLTVLEQPGRAELTQALEQGHYQVLHYAGHSNLGNAGGDLYLVSRQTGLTERISGEDLAGLLSNNGVKLAVLNSCRGAYAQSGDVELGWHDQNLAQALVNRGIPGVIAMAERIPDDVAVTFTQLLYRNLKKGNPIDLCLNRTRQGLLSAHGSHHSYWALPILYMQPGFDGYLASKVGDDNSALDKLLNESQSALAEQLDQPMRGTVKSGIEANTAPKSVKDVNLDDLVETVKLEEILSYNEEDASAMAELVEQLSQPVPPEETILANADEPLIPETLETPGLELDQQISQKPLQADTEDVTVEPIDDIETSNDSELEANSKSTSISAHRNFPGKKIAMGIGAAALLTLAGIGINDPLNWLSQPSQPGDNLPSEFVEISGLVSGDPEKSVAVLNQMVAAGEFKEAIDLIDSVTLTNANEPTLLFSKGQLQWGLITQTEGGEVTNPLFTPADAANSWRGALQAKSGWREAQVALGFAYYAIGNDDDAIEYWRKAITTSKERDVPILTFHTQDKTWPPKLHAQLGLAMITYQRADESISDNEISSFLTEATGYWQDALQTAEAEGITAKALTDDLSFHWLWSEQALMDLKTARQGIADYVSQSN